MGILREIYHTLRKVDKVVDEVTEALARSANPPSASAIVSHMTDSKDLPGQLGQMRGLQVRNTPLILRSQEEREKIEREWLRKYNPLDGKDGKDQTRILSEKKIDPKSASRQ